MGKTGATWGYCSWRKWHPSFPRFGNVETETGLGDNTELGMDQIHGNPQNDEWISFNKKRCKACKFGGSKTRGTPKSWVWIGFSIINHPFWGFSPYLFEEWVKLVQPSSSRSRWVNQASKAEWSECRVMPGWRALEEWRYQVVRRVFFKPKVDIFLRTELLLNHWDLCKKFAYKTFACFFCSKRNPCFFKGRWMKHLLFIRVSLKGGLEVMMALILRASACPRKDHQLLDKMQS